MSRILPKQPDLATIVRGFRKLRSAHARTAVTYRAGADLEHLRVGLAGAVTLEFATLPPYLCAIWSMKNDLHPVAKSLRVILQEEMLHMALVCNMLVAIGGVPRIAGGAPTYPGKLPLKVHPELTVPLRGLSREALAAFMEIERPKHVGHELALNMAREIERDDPAADGDLTIGEMYDQLLAAFQRVNPALAPDHQITGPLSWMVVRTVDEVKQAILLIQRQGEGSHGPADTDPSNLAHYWRFAEIVEKKSIVFDKVAGKYSFQTPIDLDYARDVWPMAPVPEGGYTDAVVADPEVRRLLRGFNLTYSKLLDFLQAAWETRGGQAMFIRAIETMFALEKFAKPLLQMPRSDGAGNYGPDFRYVPAKDR